MFLKYQYFLVFYLSNHEKLFLRFLINLYPLNNIRVQTRFPEPHLYDEWAEIAIEKGFSGVASGPFVRSSFKAGLLLRKTLDPNNDEVLPGAYVKVSNHIFENGHHLSPVTGESN